MAIPVATALGRRDRMWPTVIVSVAFHAAIVAWAVVHRPPPPIDLAQKPIVAKLVRLGEKRPEEWLPRKDAEAPPPPAPAAAAPVLPSAPTPAKPAAPAPKAPPRPAAPSPAAGKAGGTSLASILSKVQRQVDDQRWGDPNGDPSGNSETGTEGDRYLAMVQSALQSAYVVPATISERERIYLKATVVLFVEPNGKVLDYRFETRSGNSAYDAALERAIRAVRLPPPPPDMREQFRRSGCGVNFHL